MSSSASSRKKRRITTTTTTTTTTISTTKTSTTTTSSTNTTATTTNNSLSSLLWEGIADISPNVTRTWLWKGDDNSWNPLRISDCRELDRMESSGTSVIVDRGRATAHPSTMTLSYNYYNMSPRILTHATWFVVVVKKKVLEPLSHDDAKRVEAMYRLTLDNGIVHPPVRLSCGRMAEVVVENETTIRICRRGRQRGLVASFWGKGGSDELLQRGYGEYDIEGEREEDILGERVGHLFFVVHGIGEAYWNKTGGGHKVSSFFDEMNDFRIRLNKRQVTHWYEAMEDAEVKRQPPPPSPGRIELIPIEWYTHLHPTNNTNTSRHAPHHHHQLISTINRITLPTIPHLRSIANDIILDGLMYLTPELTERILRYVTNEMNKWFRQFREIHDSFIGCKGCCSIIGHSLGSVIVWDLLCLLKEGCEVEEEEVDEEGEEEVVMLSSPSSLTQGLCGALCCGDIMTTTMTMSPTTTSTSPPSSRRISTRRRMANGWGPSLPTTTTTTMDHHHRSSMTDKISFIPHSTYLLGSPLGLFLSLRRSSCSNSSKGGGGGKEPTMTRPKEQQQQEEEEEAPLTLPSGAIYNIFHPCDPVAYRIEPLLFLSKTKNDDDDDGSSDSGSYPSPVVLSSIHGQQRCHANNITNNQDHSSSVTQDSNYITRMLRHVPFMTTTTLNKGAATTTETSKQWRFELGGRNNRVDFELSKQRRSRRLLEFDYISSVTTAHSGYYKDENVLDLIIRDLEKKSP